jgi:hypothetical protein
MVPSRLEVDIRRFVILISPLGKTRATNLGREQAVWFHKLQG